MKKVLLSFFTFLFLILSVQADELSKFIKKENFGKDGHTSLYVVNQKNDKVIFKHNENILNIPASNVKILTVGAGYLVLGDDYQFETSIYQDLNSDIYIKLGGDVLLTQNDLNNLISNLKSIKYNNIYIDDSIFENNIYPDTWLNEDKWPYQRAITPYIVDDNYVNISINRSSLATKVDILQNDEYKLPIINQLKLGDNQSMKIVKEYGESSPIINFKGVISKDQNIVLPVFLPEVNFNIKLKKALEKNNIIYENVIVAKKMPSNSLKIASIARNIDEIAKVILYQSDNFDAEIFLRVVANKYINDKHITTTNDCNNLIKDVYSNYLKKDDKIFDASGVSRKNQISAKTLSHITSFLFKETKLEDILPTATKGTLNERLLFLSDNLKAKSGTMRGISTFSGKLTTRNKTDILFVIMSEDETRRNSLLKNYENRLIGILYKYY